jgi:DNA-binding MarR family transcriptional regulator
MRGLWRRRLPSLGPLGDDGPFTPRHLAVLAHIGSDGPRTVSQIAEELGLSLPAASRLARELEEHDFVQRTEHVDDRRRTVVDLNPLTSKQVEAWLANRTRPLSKTLDALTSDERQAFLKGLRVLAEALMEESAHGPVRPHDRPPHHRRSHRHRSV